MRNKSHIIDLIHAGLAVEENPVEKRTISAVVDEFLFALKTLLKNKAKVQFRGFGTFSTKPIKELKRKNPFKPTEDVVIPEHLRPRFAASKTFKAYMNS